MATEDQDKAVQALAAAEDQFLTAFGWTKGPNAAWTPPPSASPAERPRDQVRAFSRDQAVPIQKARIGNRPLAVGRVKCDVCRGEWSEGAPEKHREWCSNNQKKD